MTLIFQKRMHHEFKATTYISAFHCRDIPTLHAVHKYDRTGKRTGDRENVLVPSCHAFLFGLRLSDVYKRQTGVMPILPISGRK